MLNFKLPKYKQIKEKFLQDKRLKILRGREAWDTQNWPNGAGVYLIWQCHPDANRRLLYIGKAGKFQRRSESETELNGGNLAKRLERWTPYCFQQEGQYGYYFEYGPNASVNEILKLQTEQRYRHHVLAEEIEVECLCLQEWERKLSPALLEALLLQDYMCANGYLPIANNEL